MGRPDRRADGDVPQHLDHLDGRQSPGRQVEQHAYVIPQDGTGQDGTGQDGTGQDGTGQDGTAWPDPGDSGGPGGPGDSGGPGGPGGPGDSAGPGDDDGPDGQSTGRTPVARAGLILAVVGVVVVVAGAAGVAVMANSRAGATSHARAAAAARLVNRTGTAGAPVRLDATTPRTGSTGVNGATTIQFTFSAPLGATVPDAVLTPHLAGRWQVSGRTLTFTPAAPLPPRTTIRVTIPAGLRSATGARLGHPVLLRLRTAGYSPMRLAELLSQLGYLPVSWQPTAGRRLIGGGSSGSGLAAQAAMAYSAPAGRFSWSQGYPALLRSQWGISFSDPMIRGAVMAFQSQHGMTVNGTVDHALWRRLFAAAASGRRNTVGYTYAIASKNSPETLTIWHNGHVVLHSLANTGIPVSPTVDGTFPVYLRYRFQIMRGTNPDGSTYADPVSFVSYFNGGDAVHYFPRGSYGFPQSLGCVELPYGAAKQAWPYLTYGSLVTVTG